MVCGLGSLGQHCVANLKPFDVGITAVELAPPTLWEIKTLPDQLDQLVIGDCRQAEILEQAGVKHCRAILLVTANEQTNLEAALTARVLNPAIRLVVRSDKQNLNELLAQQLDNFVAFEPTQLAAPAFALAALGEELLGFFSIGTDQFRIRKQTITPDHRWCNQRSIHEIDTCQRRVLRHIRADLVDLYPDAQIPLLDNPQSPSAQFYRWLPNAQIRSGDVVVTVEAERVEAAPLYPLPPRPWQRRRQKWGARAWRQRLRDRTRVWQGLLQWWRASYGQHIHRVAWLCALTVLILCLGGTVLMTLTDLTPSLADGFYTTVVLLLGGYGDIFGQIDLEVPLPWWLRLFSLGLTLAGTAFIGVLYALLTEKLLTLKFHFLTRRPPVPEQEHVVVMSLGRVGRGVVQLLQGLKQPVVGLTRQALTPDTLPEVPLIAGTIDDGFERSHLARAKSVVAVGEDEMQNLELGLMAHRANPNCRLIIRTYDQIFTDKVAHLFPYAQVLCASALSAEAFTGAAFGENMVSLFQLYHQTVLVTQFVVEAEDTLKDLMLADMAYGYGVVPILYQRHPAPPVMMPSEEIRLKMGDRVVVLATIRGLRRIEQGNLALKQWQIQVDQAFSEDAEFEGASELARLSGCAIGEARQFMTQLPGVFPHRLYRHQALGLVRVLTKARVQAKILPLEDRYSPNRS
ncbi:MAG: NAD-binding protein [Cyanobacteria bacterium]|nr:NAD-binding protein [Cyanobacteriota bacterium]